MEGPVLAAVIIATAGLVASVIAAVVGAVAQYRLNWYAARRPAYVSLLDTAASSYALQAEAAHLLRASPLDLRPLVAARRIRRDAERSAADLRVAIFSVQLLATPDVFQAADRLLNVVAAGAETLSTVTDDRATWKRAGQKLDLLGDELLQARDSFVDAARDELRLPPLGDRPSGEDEVRDLLQSLSPGSAGRD